MTPKARLLTLAVCLAVGSVTADAQCYAFSGAGVSYTMNIQSVAFQILNSAGSAFGVQQIGTLTLGGTTYSSTFLANLTFGSIGAMNTNFSAAASDALYTPPWSVDVLLEGPFQLLPTSPPATLPAASAWSSGPPMMYVSVNGATQVGYPVTSVGPCTGGTGASSVSGKSLGDTSSDPGACNCDDPVDLGSGNLFQSFVDDETAGSNKLRFVHYYNSLGDTKSLAKTLGSKWRSNFDRYLQISGSSVIAERADGEEISFAQSGASWTSDTDVDVTLTNSGSNWTLVDKDDTVETYTTVGGTEGQLQTIAARNGYTQTLHYNSSNQLANVTDSYNRQLTLAYQGALLQSVTTADGLIITFGFGGNQLSSVQYSTSPGTTQSYVYENSSLPSALTGIVDEDGNRYATWTYDSSGRVLTGQLASGTGLNTFVYNSDGSRQVTNPLGEQELFKFTTLQGVPKLTEIDRLSGSTIAAAIRTFTYDSNGYTASATDWNGNTTDFVNNSHGHPVNIVEAAGTAQARTTTVAYLSNYHLPAQIVTPGLTTNYSYDGSGNLLTETLTDTTTTSSPYATSGQTRTWTLTWSNFLVASVKNPRTDVNAVSRFGYDASGALTSVTNAANQTTQITQHTPGGRPLTVVDRNGVQTQLTYDARRRLLTSTLATAAGPLTTQYSYDSAGNVLTVTQPDGSAHTSSYDGAHRLTGITDLLSNSVAYTLDAAGDRTRAAVSNAGAAVTLQHSGVFDALGRVLQDIGGASQITAFAYDSNGNEITITDGLQRVTHQTFDALNRRVSISNPAQGITAFTYDAHSRPLTITNPNGGVTSYVYDGFGDVIQEGSPARGTTVYHYNPTGDLVQKVDARGAVVNYTYDALGRILTTTYPADAAENVAYTYDQPSGGFGVGRLTSQTDAAGSLTRSYDERGNVLAESRTFGASATLSTSYTYDAASRIASIRYPSGTVVAYARDSMGRVTATTATAPGASQPVTVLAGIAYQPFGPANALTYGNGIAESRNFDLDYRITGLADTGNAAVQNLSYGYNALNDVLSINDAVTPANSQSFGYDAVDRLTSASGGYGSLAYSYDANGNRLTENPAAPINLDGLGAVTALAYNQAGRLASTATTGSAALSQYTYSASGQRVAKVGSTSGASLFQYDGRGQLLEETDGQGNVRADYIYLDGRPVAEWSAGKLYFLHGNSLGAPQVATDPTQATAWAANYQPFGALSSSSQTALLGQDLRLPGQENDLETGLYHNGFRNYAPGLGRYLESDPIGLMGGANTYGYAAQNPGRFIDSAGLNITVNYYGGKTGHVGLSIGNLPSVGYYSNNGESSIGGIELGPTGLVTGVSGAGIIRYDYAIQGPPTDTFVIETTADQDAAAIAAVNALITNSGSYNLYGNNCTTVAEDILRNIGIPNVPTTIVPAYLIPELRLPNMGNDVLLTPNDTL